MPRLGRFLNSRKSEADFLNSVFLNSGRVLYVPYTAVVSKESWSQGHYVSTDHEQNYNYVPYTAVVSNERL